MQSLKLIFVISMSCGTNICLELVTTKLKSGRRMKGMDRVSLLLTSLVNVRSYGEFNVIYSMLGLLFFLIENLQTEFGFDPNLAKQVTYSLFREIVDRLVESPEEKKASGVEGLPANLKPHKSLRHAPLTVLP